MSSNRLMYDNCAYAKILKESTQPLEYNLYVGKYILNKQCPVGDFANELDFGVRADTESELYGLNRHSTSCPEKKYTPKSFTPPNFSPARMCENIYYITPSNLEKPTSSMIGDVVRCN